MSTYRVTSANGADLGTYDDLAVVKGIVADNPGATVKPVPNTVANPCSKHPAFEADYCPSCGTSRQIGKWS